MAVYPALAMPGRHSVGLVGIRRDLLWVRHRLVGAWFSEAAVGTILREHSGRGGQGSLVSGDVTWSRSPWGPALTFGGSTGRVQIPRAKNPRLLSPWGRFTIMALCRPTSYSSGVTRILDYGARGGVGTSVGPFGWSVDNLNYTAGLSIRLADAAGSTALVGTSGPVTLNTWQMLGITSTRRTDSASQSWKYTMYRDGRPFSPSYSARVASLPPTIDPHIGAEDDGESAFTGQIAGVWLWDYGMHQAQVARFTADPFAAWRYDLTPLLKPGQSAGAPAQGGGIPAILRRRHGGL